MKSIPFNFQSYRQPYSLMLVNWTIQSIGHLVTRQTLILVGWSLRSLRVAQWYALGYLLLVRFHSVDEKAKVNANSYM